MCEHSLMYSRGSLGFLDYTDEEKAMFKPVRQRLVRTHPVTGRKSLYLSSHAGAILGMPMPEARILLRDLTEHATQPQLRLRAQVDARTTSSCGTTARPCTACAATTRPSRATCAAPRWPAMRRRWRSKRPSSRKARQTSARQPTKGGAALRPQRLRPIRSVRKRT